MFDKMYYILVLWVYMDKPYLRNVYTYDLRNRHTVRVTFFYELYDFMNIIVNYDKRRK